MLNVARGGVLVDGNGGDEILGTRRITPVRNVLRSVLSGERPRGCRAALRAVSPQPVRRHLALRDVWRPEWLREPVASTVARRRAFDDVAMSPHAGKQTWELAHRRMYRRFVDLATTLAAELGAEYRAPLLEPVFLSALARELGPWGWRDRTDSMTRLFGDVLPPAVLGRTSKALFTQVNFTEHSREFARSWDGTGINDSIIDGELIRAEWLSPLPRFGAMAPLQSAWLAGQPRATGSDGAPV
jgi:asparagine synthase (glutamine-hydrolysing)